MILRLSEQLTEETKERKGEQNQPRPAASSPRAAAEREVLKSRNSGLPGQGPPQQGGGAGFHSSDTVLPTRPRARSALDPWAGAGCQVSDKTAERLKPQSTPSGPDSTVGVPWPGSPEMALVLPWARH